MLELVHKKVMIFTSATERTIVPLQSIIPRITRLRLYKAYIRRDIKTICLQDLRTRLDKSTRTGD